MATKRLEILNKIGVHGGVVSHTVENGVVRMKILVKRQQLEQVLEQVTKKRDHDNNKQNHNVNVNIRRLLSRSTASKSSLEQRIKDMKRSRSKQIKGDCRSNWRPALQSIPEAFAF